MWTTEQQKRRWKARFPRSRDYRIVGATGALGGPTPSGEILMEFYVEHKSTPESIQLELQADGTETEVSRADNEFFDRGLQIGVLMRPDIAKTIGEWLIQHAESMIYPRVTLDS